ncbi:MAG TPA: hypothetical protein VHO84_12865 [Syntrophorhabdaceae bacterium]|nr:hypothetical protein [Syntrophorhabdaceae bacterium]
MKRLAVFALLPILLVGCSSVGVLVTPENNAVQMPHYAFRIPPDQGWEMRKMGGNSESVLINNKAGAASYQIALMRNVVLDANMRTQSANTVADHFRGMEEQIMIEEGVKRGRYQLKNLVKDVRRLGDRTFYTMTYEATSGAQIQFASIYLLFPKAEGNDSFIVAHYTATLPFGAALNSSYKADFDAILQEMVIH